MNRIHIFNWLPIADNMLPEISINLAALKHLSRIEKDSVLFDINDSFALESSKNIRLPYHGKINQRGFSQITLEIIPIHGMSLSSVLNDIIPQFQDHVAELLANICPFAVRNKFAVIYEGIVSSQEFESSKFDPSINKFAIASLKKLSYISIQVDKEYQDDVETGFDLPELELNIPSGNKNTSVFINNQQDKNPNCFLFYSENYAKDEDSPKEYPFDSVIYKYFAFLTFANFSSRVIEILKDTRDHVVPLRRRLSIALQRRTEEYLDTLTRIKKYLTYINIKLPVIYKTINHLNDAITSDQFKAKIESFEIQKISSYPTISFINRTFKKDGLDTESLINKIRENVGQRGRLQYLFEENEKEAEQFSSELSQILSGSFLSENVQKLTKVVETLRNQLEVARGGKHRENALKVLSILLFANFGVTIFTQFGFSGIPLLLLAGACSLFALVYIQWTIWQKSSYFQLEIPVKKSMNRTALKKFTQGQSLKSSEIRGESRQKTWAVQLFTDKKSAEKYYLNRESRFSNIPFVKRLLGAQKFDLTLEYEKHGYVHTIQLEKEYKNAKFDYSVLVFQILYLLAVNNVKVVSDPRSKEETSLYVELLSNLDINVDPSLEGLNAILKMPSDDLQQALQSVTTKDFSRDETALSRDDKALFEDIVNRRNEYLAWLLNKRETIDVERDLYGEDNLDSKIETIKKIKPDRGEKSDDTPTS